jgi:hypothetical protein
MLFGVQHKKPRPSCRGFLLRNLQNVASGCPLMTQSGHPKLQRTCPLSGVKRTWRFAAQMSAFDPKRTSELSPFQRAGHSRYDLRP